jgi:hypothetical protein
MTLPGRNALARLAVATLALASGLALVPALAHAQGRERPVPFDSAGRILAITPSLAARLGLAPPAWPVAGDYVDARLYALEDTMSSAVLVVRRPREVLERYALTVAQRRELTVAVNRGLSAMRIAGGPDSLATSVSQPVRGWFIANQTILGVALFGPAAAALPGNAAGGTAAYLAVAGGTFFLAADRARRTSISRAQNHLAWHGSLHGATAGALAAYSLGGESLDGAALGGALLVGGIIGDVVGYQVARPMTDAEAHGASHGAYATASVGLGTLVSTGMWKDESSRRVATSLVIGAGAVGYPLGLRYARTSAYRVTSGDVGTLIVGELLGTTAVGTFLPQNGDDEQPIAAVLTAGFLAGAVVADRLLVRRFDYGESESRLLQLGTVAGAVVGLVVPVLAQADGPLPYFGLATLGGLAGAIGTHNLIGPARADAPVAPRTGARTSPSRFSMRFTPQNLMFVRTGREGVYPVVNLQF